MQIVEVARWRSYYPNNVERFLQMCVGSGNIEHLTSPVLQEVLVESKQEDVRLDRSRCYFVTYTKVNSNEQTEVYAEKRNAKIRIRKLNEGVGVPSTTNEFVVFYLE